MRSKANKIFICVLAGILCLALLVSIIVYALY